MCAMLGQSSVAHSKHRLGEVNTLMRLIIHKARPL